jgi:hypothetical protein
MKRSGHGTTAVATAILTALALATGARTAHAQGPGTVSSENRAVRIEARFIEPASGQDAPWGATGQILIESTPADPAAERWRQVRALASSPSRQGVTIEPGGRGLIRVGREIPFAGWFLRRGVRCGLLEPETEWREVESALEIAVGAPAADGTLRVVLTPEFGYRHGRSRRTVSFPAESAEIVVTPGVETRFAPAAGLEVFYRRLLAGYDPMRRVLPVDIALRADFVEP